MQNILRNVPSRNSCTMEIIYSKCLRINRVINPILVQREAIKFMRMVFRKLADAVFFQTRDAHIKKYTRIGNIQVANNKKSFIRWASEK